MYQVTIHYVDVNSDASGYLVLAGEPFTVHAGEECPLCSNLVTEQGPELRSGDTLVSTPEGVANGGAHLGYLTDSDETMHLRCAMDLVEMGSLEIRTGWH